MTWHTTWEDSLLDGLPDSLLRWFACDCAGRALIEGRRRGMEFDPQFSKTINVARDYAQGKVDGDALMNAELSSWEVARVLEKSSWFAACAASWCAEANARTSAKMSARNASALYSDGKRSGHPLAIKECQWQAQHIESLKLIWFTCGERMAEFLLHDSCPLDFPDIAEGLKVRQP